MALLLELSNPVNWVPLWSGRLTESFVGESRRRIPDIVVPVQASEKIIVAEVTSLAGSPGWRDGGWLRARVLTGNPGMDKLRLGDTRLILGERTMVNLGDFGQYEINISVPKYMPSYEVDIWEYVGPMTDTYEALKGRNRVIIPYSPNTSPVMILPKTENRVSATLYNSSSVSISIGFNSSVSFTNPVEVLSPGGQWVSDGSDIGEVWLVADAVSSASLQVVEYRSG
jgi:hypothetical protein